MGLAERRIAKSFQELKPSNCICKKADKIPCLYFYGDQLFQRILTFDLIPVDEMARLKQIFEGNCLIDFNLTFHKSLIVLNFLFQKTKALRKLQRKGSPMNLKTTLLQMLKCNDHDQYRTFNLRIRLKRCKLTRSVKRR